MAISDKCVCTKCNSQKLTYSVKILNCNWFLMKLLSIWGLHELNFDLCMSILQVMADNSETRKDLIKGNVSSQNNTNWNEIYVKLLVKVNQVSEIILYTVVWETINSSSNLFLQLKYHIIFIHFSSLVSITSLWSMWGSLPLVLLVP